MRGRHLDEGTLRAHADGELPALASLRAWWHLYWCPDCRRALNEQRELGARAGALLSSLATPIDVTAAWQRVGARLGLGGSSHRTRTIERSLGLGVALAIAVAVLVHATSVERLVHGWALSSGEQARDVCCFDLDGGGPGDDGILTLSRRGERVDCVLVYDDIDRSRTFSAGDRTRYASPAGRCERVTTEHVARVAGRPALVSSALGTDDARDYKEP